MKKVGLLLVMGILVAAIPATIFLVGKNQELRKRAAPATSLAFSPASITKRVDDVFSVEATIDTGQNQVVAVELQVVFDPIKLEAQTITNGALFPNILASGVVDRGTATITLGAQSSTTPVTGNGTVAVIRFKALAKTDTPVQIRFADNTYVGSLGEGSVNVLVGSTPANVTITDGSSAGASPTPTPTPTPIAGASPTPTTKAGATPMPTQKIATPSGQASSSATLITSPVNEGSTVDTTPTIKGKAAPGATVTVTIYSTPQTVVVVADANGNWTYTPTTPLEEGPHSVVITATNPSGETTTTSTSFVIATGSAQPIAGSMEVTYTLVGLAILLLISGVAIPVVMR